MVRTISPRALYSVLVDWAGNGSFTADLAELDIYDDVSGRVLREAGITYALGVDIARGVSAVMAPSASMVLLNHDRRFSPEGGPLSGNLLPGRDVLIQAFYGDPHIVMDDATATMDDLNVFMDGFGAATLFRGVTEEPTQNTEIGNRSVNLPVVGRFATLLRQTITTDVYADITTGAAMQVVFEAAGLAPDRYFIHPDVIANGRTISWFWVDDQGPYDVAGALLNTEGYPAKLFEDADGVICFYGRNAAILDTTSNTSQATFTDRTAAGEAYMDDATALMDDPIIYMDGAAESLFFTGLRYVSGQRDIVNRAALDIAIRQAAPLAPVWTYAGTITLNGSGAGSVIAKLTDPAINAVCALGDGDFLLTIGSVTVTLSRDSGTTIRVTFTGGTPGAVVSALRLRAQALTSADTVTIENGITATDSIAKYGLRSFNPPALNEITPGDAQALCDSLVLERQEPRAQVEIDVASVNGSHLRQMLTMRPGWRITVVDAHTGLSADMMVCQLRHKILGRGKHYATIVCEKALDHDWGIWGLSVFGTGVWGA